MEDVINNEIKEIKIQESNKDLINHMFSYYENDISDVLIPIKFINNDTIKCYSLSISDEMYVSEMDIEDIKNDYYKIRNNNLENILIKESRNISKDLIRNCKTEQRKKKLQNIENSC